MAVVIKPPSQLCWPQGMRSIFLAGSIEQGQAERWQARFEAELAGLDVAILNPRRDDWDAGWKQSAEDARFRAQVEWELGAQDKADLIAMYFAPQTRAPITLLELGLFARSGRLLVCCPEGFWRRGNVQVVCARYRVPTCPSLEELIALAAAKLAVQ